MAKRSKTPSGGWSRGKVVAIGMLAIVLLLVIVSQFGGRKQPAAARPAASRTVSGTSASKRSPAPTDGASAAKPPEQRSETPWPTFDVAEVVTSNPFVLPEVLLAPPEAEQTLPPSSTLGEAETTLLTMQAAAAREMRRRQAEFLAGLRAEGVDMILRSPRGSVARIGTLSLRVGDVHEGLRVEQIGEHGVVFAPAVAAEGQPE